MGAGLAQFIMVLGNVAFRQPSFILIDEPELNLHPSLQLDYVNTLASYASQGLLFGTHSVGLARTASEYTYALTKETNAGASVDTQIQPLIDTANPAIN
jgi:predicted ATPase